MQISYKKLEQEDIPILTPLMKAAFDEDTKMHTDLLEDGPIGYDTGELLENMLHMENSVSKVILYDGKPIGAYTVIKEKDMYTLDLIFIDPQYACKGIGSIVWNDIEKEYHEAKTWIVETPSYSMRNHNFYKKCGFKVIKEVSYSDGAKSFVFIKHMKTSPIHIREYCEETDYNNILESCRKEHWKNFYETKKEQYKEALKRSITYVAYEEERYCGYIRCITDEVFTTYCCEIIVDDIYKRRGVGKALIEKVRMQYPSTCIDVLSDNDEFYQSNQFLILCNGMRKMSKE